MHAYLRYVAERQEELIGQIHRLVECESPSESIEDVVRCQTTLAELAGEVARPTWIQEEAGAPSLLLEFGQGGSNERGSILGLGHADTVWPKGTLATMPFRQSDGRLWGPGVLDMKAGLVFFLWAVKLLRDFQVPLRRNVRLLIVGDEETGSQGSRSTTEAFAQEGEMVIVLEPGTGLDGKLKTARKGIGRYSIQVLGKAAHAGVDFEAGASATVELAAQILELNALTDLTAGTTVNVGLIRGGTKSNVVAAEATAEIDIRVVKAEEAEVLHRKLLALEAKDKRCRVVVSGGLNRPPMERSPQIAELFAKAATIARSMGIPLEESATGGGSDGNFTAALGIPTLDGLGAVGEGAHANHESLVVSRIPERVALLASLLSEL